MGLSYVSDDCIAALATARGKAALALVRASGPGTIEAFAEVFSRPHVLLESSGNTVHYGWIRDAEGQDIDEVMVSLFRSPASYTGQDSVEISCHGGMAVVDRILDVLRAAGFRDAAPGEFTYRAFASGKMDLTRAEAIREIIDARTDRARAMAVLRLSGSISRVVDSAKDIVRYQAAIAALALDYPEDEIETISFDLEKVERAAESLRELAATWTSGRIYGEGVRVAFAGPANAGKSSLFNLFLKEERSIVSEIPGTTRDWLEAWVSLDGLPVRLVDTAGLRHSASDSVEAEGIRRTRNMISGADILVAVADGTAGQEEALALEKETLSGVSDSAPGLVRVWNKADLAPDAPSGWLPVSALTGAGFAKLEQAVHGLAFKGGAPPEDGAPIIDSVRQRNLLERAVEALERFMTGAGCDDDSAVGTGPVTADLLAEDLRDALDALGELTGEVTRADVLETLFGEFCVGK